MDRQSKHFVESSSVKPCNIFWNLSFPGSLMPLLEWNGITSLFRTRAYLCACNWPMGDVRVDWWLYIGIPDSLLSQGSNCNIPDKCSNVKIRPDFMRSEELQSGSWILYGSCVTLKRAYRSYFLSLSPQKKNWPTTCGGRGGCSYTRYITDVGSDFPVPFWYHFVCIFFRVHILQKPVFAAYRKVVRYNAHFW